VPVLDGGNHQIPDVFGGNAATPSRIVSNMPHSCPRAKACQIP
jgi:hypothetical protein